MGSPSDEKKMITEPLLISRNPKGGFRTMPFILANEAFERLASIGLLQNMILYLTREYNMEMKVATNVLFIWSAVSDFLPILGAIVADSYVGRYPVIGFGCISSLLGMILLWFTAIFPPLKPPACDQVSNNNCESPSASQLLFLYSAFVLMSIGAGGIRSSSLAFGADQLDKGDKIKNAGLLQSYFSWYYASVSASSMFAVTLVVYIQDNLGWKIGFGVPVVMMLLSALSFFLASPFYVKFKADTSLLTGLAQVIVASYKKRHINLSSQATGEMYLSKKGSMFLMPTENLRCLNKACIISPAEEDLTPDGRASNPWSLCTVDQVEDLKAVIKVIPMWSTGIMIAVTISQHSFSVLQASSMDRHITPNFEIPSGSFGIFTIITLVIWVGLYDRIIIPIASKIKGKPCHLSLKQRMGIGLLLSVVSMVAWAIVESIRRKLAIKGGISDDPGAVGGMSAMYLIPHYVLSGLANAFNVIGQNEFYYSELPKSMSSIASTIHGLGLSVAYLAASFIFNTVNDITKRGGKESWVANNINKGHYDYYLWLLAGLNLANLTYYLACSKAYGPCKGDVRRQ